MGSKVQNQNQEARRTEKAIRRWRKRGRLSPEREAAMTAHLTAVRAGKTPPLNTGKAQRREAQQRREAALLSARAAAAPQSA
jgi:hypothetical protein